MNTATILITMPRKKGDPTEFTFQWATKAVQIAKDLGYNVITIKEKDTIYDNVSKILKENNVRLFSHFGHGCIASLQGNNECIITHKYNINDLFYMAESSCPKERQKLLKLLNPIGKLSCPGICSIENDPCGAFCSHPTNADLLKDTISFAVACYSAVKLGESAIEHGCQTYIGESDLLMFPVDSLGSQDIFGEVQLTMFKELLLGNTVQGAEKVMSELEDSYIRQFKDTKYISLPMLWNKMKRKVLGNSNAMIYE